MLCPTKCGGGLSFESEGVVCRRCGYALVYTAGRVLDFVSGASETQLDVSAYDKVTSDPAVIAKVFGELQDVLDRIGKSEIPVTVEFGAGTGAWTIGMDQSERFSELYASDISLQFQTLLGTRVGNAGTHLICQSAEALDFEAGSVDLVAGRSFLHHILDYEALLAKCAHWLAPGGVAVFYEPCMQGKIWVAFFAELIRRIDVQYKIKALNAEQSNRLQGLMRHILKDFYKKDIETLRPLTEDKWIFDADALRGTAAKVGFSGMSVIDTGAQDLVQAIKYSLMGAIKDLGIIQRYTPVVETLMSTVATGLPQMVTSPMVFFVFTK